MHDDAPPVGSKVDSKCVTLYDANRQRLRRFILECPLTYQGNQLSNLYRNNLSELNASPL